MCVDWLVYGLGREEEGGLEREGGLEVEEGGWGGGWEIGRLEGGGEEVGGRGEGEICASIRHVGNEACVMKCR